MEKKVTIKETKSVETTNPILIQGFPGMGMIGTISSAYLAEKLGMELVGEIESDYFPPISAIHDYKPVPPARVYASKEHDLIVLFSEFVIPANIVNELTEEILDYAKQKNVSTIYSLAGIAVPQPKGEIHGIPSNQKMADKLKAKNVQLIKEGATQGVSGILIAECAARGINAANVLSETNQPLDPKAAATLLDKISEISGVKIDTKDLREEGNKVREKMRETVQKMKEFHEDYEKHGPNPMYG